MLLHVPCVVLYFIIMIGIRMRSCHYIFFLMINYLDKKKIIKKNMEGADPPSLILQIALDL